MWFCVGKHFMVGKGALFIVENGVSKLDQN
jgi:hypothetical protein